MFFTNLSTTHKYGVICAISPSLFITYRGRCFLTPQDFNFSARRVSLLLSPRPRPWVHPRYSNGGFWGDLITAPRRRATRAYAEVQLRLTYRRFAQTAVGAICYKHRMRYNARDGHCSLADSIRLIISHAPYGSHTVRYFSRIRGSRHAAESTHSLNASHSNLYRVAIVRNSSVVYLRISFFKRQSCSYSSTP